MNQKKRGKSQSAAKNRAARNRAGGFVVLFCVVLMVLVSAKLQAQTQSASPVRLTPDEAVEIAFRNNLSLLSSRTSLETKRRASNLSWNQFIPQITVAGVLNRDNQASAVSGLVPVDQFPLNPLFGGMLPQNVPNFYGVVPYSVDAPQWHIVGSLQVSLNLSMAMLENMNRLRLDYETGVLSLDRARAQLERDVRKAYHNMLLLQENIALLRSSFENVGRQVQMAQALYNSGLAPELTLLQARVALENLRPVIDQAENGLRLYMAQFAMFLGMDYNTQFELIPISNDIDFIPIDVAEMITRAASQKPDILELRQTIMMLQSARKIQVNTLIPTLSLSWSYNPIFTRDPFADSWFNGDYWMDRGSLSITLAVRLHSLLPWSGDSQAITNLDDQIRTANIGLAQMVTGTEIEVYNTVLSLERTRVNAQALTQTVNLAQQSYRLTEQAYQAGLQDYFQVQNAEQSLMQARVQLLEQHFNYLNGLIDLEYSTGVPFGTLSGRR